MLLLRDGRYKYTCTSSDPARLYDLIEDPQECNDLSNDPQLAHVESDFRARAERHWDDKAVRTDVIASQKRRHYTHEALQAGAVRSWDFQPYRQASRQYNRNLSGEMCDTERRARIPYREPPLPDGGGRRKR